MSSTHDTAPKRGRRESSSAQRNVSTSETGTKRRNTRSSSGTGKAAAAHDASSSTGGAVASSSSTSTALGTRTRSAGNELGSGTEIGGASKRQRRQSPRKSLEQAGQEGPIDPRLKGKEPTSISSDGVKATRRPIHPYPISLTPFRYPCLTPHIPPPPPGDPTDPNFKKFDPAPEITSQSRAADAAETDGPRDGQTTGAQGEQQQQQQQTVVQNTDMQDHAQALAGLTGLGDISTDAAAYESLSALLNDSGEFQQQFMELYSQPSGQAGGGEQSSGDPGGDAR